MHRYKTLLRLARDRRPERLLEIGTWNGQRASQFIAMTGCQYVGFDLFEEADDDSDEKEKNVKGHVPMPHVAMNIEATGSDRYLLVRGNTRYTLPRYLGGEYGEPGKFDFVFIDGGHSIETIRSDWKHVRKLVDPGAVVVFDGYYFPRIPKLGCNTIVDRLQNVEITDLDPVIGGRFTSLAIHTVQ